MEIRIRRSDADRAKQRFDVSSSPSSPSIAARCDVSNSIMEGVSRRRRRNGDSNEELLIGEEQVIRWEKILPRRFLRVLLVENDDSTRHIVAALLRKCNYQVSAVADGLKAWTVLKERHYNFDLVLTEVVMPSLSGISLLSKIMSNEIFKTIPVIMMSSNDSIGVVFKCMLKGASDFLVKPVRKNELRNLWQHVWRKYSSGSCGDASENGNGNQTKPETVFENEVASNHGSADAGSRSRTGDSSDKRSGIQSSCREAEMEIDSGQKPEQPIETQNRVASKDTNTDLEKDAFNMPKVATPSGHEEGKTKDMFIQMETEVAISIHRVNPTEKVWGADGPHHGTPCTAEYPASGRSNQHANIDAMNKLPKEIIDFIGAATTKQCGNRVMGDNDQRGDILNASAKSSVAKWNVCSSSLTPLLELSLRRPQHIEEELTLNSKHVLNHSVASAFSRYKNATYGHLCPRSGSSSMSLGTRTNECGNSNPGNCSSAQNGENILFPLIERAASTHGAEVPLYTQISYVSDKQDVDPRPSVPLRGKVPSYTQTSYVSDKQDADPQPSVPLRGKSYQGITSITKELSLHPQLGSVPFTIPIGAIPFPSICTSYGAIVQPIFYPEASVPVSGSVEGQKDTVVIPFNPSARNSNNLINNFQCHNYVNQLERGMEVQRVGIKSSYPGVVLQPPVEKVSLGSHHSCVVTIASGSNAGYGDKSLLPNRGTALDIGNEDELQNCNGKESECDRSRREAALNKFRMKRKDRCFEKKVRYHNRKKLAEQRPRLKGQFVRQTITEPTTKATETAD